MSKFTTLVTKLREVFQIDRPDLDFGIYRIMNARAAQITRYLEQDLREKVSSALSSVEKSDTEEGLASLRKELEGFFTPSAFSADGTLTDNNALATAKGKEYLALHSKFLIQNSQLNAGPEDQVYSHLLTFFSRYYEKGDYISKRRYKGDTYAIPYSGEEVVLHWANKDQYYIKSGESFTNYSFKLNDDRRVSFQLLAADTAKDNRKDNEENRLFALIPEKYSLTKTDDDGEEITTTYEPIQESEDGDLIIHFTYQGYPKSIKKKDKNADSLKRILRHDLVTTKWTDLHTRKPTEKDKDRTLLEYHLTTYTEKNSSDYFIHKDLGRFLRNELDFYIKNEVMHLDDVQNADTFDAIKDTLRLIQTLREIALNLIRFLAQLEDFQKKLWLKKKFVTQTDYALTLDRIPASLYSEIAANEAQREEWIKLYAIDEIKAAKGDLAQEDTAGYSASLTVEFLQQNSHLVLDTAHFPEEFKAQLLNAIPNLDESLDGLVIHSENFQALSLLQERYREKVKCVYIDPPYNTDGSPILYKNGFRSSTWVTLIDQLLEETGYLMNPEGVIGAAIDDAQSNELVQLLKNNFDGNFLGTMCIRSNPSGRPTESGYSVSHEYLHFAGKSQTSVIGRLPANDHQQARFNQSDEKGKFEWRNLRREGSNSDRNARRALYYPIYIKESEFRIPNLDWDKVTETWVIKEEPLPNESVVFPDNDEGAEKTWRWQWKKVQTSDEIAVRKDRSGKDYIYLKRRPNTEGVVSVSSWFDSKYSATEHGTAVIKSLFGASVFSFPKSIFTLEDAITVSGGNSPTLEVLDYFAGSGTTGHAVINLNREDGGKRKYILVEMGAHFDTVLCPRLKKVAYSPKWKNGKPTTRNTGISHGFKYLRLESYEDVLNNLQLPKDESDLLSEAMGQDYQLGYMLDVEARASLLSVADFQKPFDYQLNIATESSGASEPRPIDLIETFNYLIGLTVEHYDRNLDRGYAKITGTLPTGEKTLILWRDCEKIGYEELDELCKKWDISPRQKEYDLVYLNGDHNLPNVLEELAQDGGTTKELRLRQIEPEFLDRMFAEN